MPSDDDMGNSEVGHNALGAGRVFDQGAKLVAEAIGAGALFERRRPGRRSPQRVREQRHGHALHRPALDGNVHSHIDHLLAHAASAATRRACAACASTRCSTGATCRRPARSSTSTRSRSCSRASTASRAATTASPRAAAAWSSPWIATRPTGAWSSAAGDPRARRGAHASRARARPIETFRDEQPGIGDQNLPPFVIVGDDGKPVGPHRGRRRASCSSTSAATAPSRSAGPSRVEQFDKFDRERLPGRVVRRHDAVRRRPASCPSASWWRRPPSTARWASTSRATASASSPSARRRSSAT